MSDWLKPPKLIYLVIGLPLLAAIVGLGLQAVGWVTFP